MKRYKKNILTILSFIVIQNINAQVREILEAVKPQKVFTGTPALQKKYQVLQIGIGVPNNVASLINAGGLGSFLKIDGSKIGPLFIAYEYLLKDNVGIGVTLAYAKATETYKNPFGTNTKKANLSGKSILLSTTYHLYLTDKIDPYTKGSLGLNIWKGSYKNDDGSNAGTLILPTPISYSGVVGLRYFTKNTLLAFGELSYSSLKFTATIGIGLKLK